MKQPTDTGNLLTIKKHGTGATKYYAVSISKTVINEDHEYYFRDYTSAFQYRKDSVHSLMSQVKHNSLELRLSAPTYESNRCEYNADNFRSI